MNIDNYQIEQTGFCPFCVTKNDLDYYDHAIAYICKLCGFSTKFIDSDGFKEWEIDKENGEDFEDAVMRTEKEALDEVDIKYHEPTQATVEAVKTFQNLASKIRYIFDIYDDTDEMKDRDRMDISHLARFLVKEIFKED